MHVGCDLTESDRFLPVFSGFYKIVIIFRSKIKGLDCRPKNRQLVEAAQIQRIFPCGGKLSTDLSTDSVHSFALVSAAPRRQPVRRISPPCGHGAGAATGNACAARVPS